MTKEIKILSKKLPIRNDSNNKGDFGRLSVIAGSDRFRGAASLAVRSALRSGVGLVNLVSTEGVISSVSNSASECTFLPVKENKDGGIDACDFTGKQRCLKSSDAILIGCGMGNTNDTLKILSSVISNFSCPIVIDADALNSMKNCPERLNEAKRRPIVTPHIGEMSRLTGLSTDEIKAERVKVALDFSKKYNCITVLKDSVTAVTDPEGEVFLSTVENSGLAKGGSGDVLSGIIASLLCQGLDAYDSACMGVLLHSISGEICADRLGKEFMLPSDVIVHLSDVFVCVRKEREK